MKFRKAIFNLNVDDLHPEQGFSKEQDEGNFRYINKLREEFPKLKVTLFVTPNWKYIPPRLYNRYVNYFRTKNKFLKYFLGREWNGEPFLLDKHPDWCRWIRRKIGKNFEIGVHGLTHSSGVDRSEFNNLSIDEAKVKIMEAEKIFIRNKIPFKKIFRGPGIDVNSNLVIALSELGYKAANTIDFWTPIGENNYSEKGWRCNILYPTYLSNVLNVPANCDAKFTDLERVKEIINYNGLMSFNSHICGKYFRSPIHNALSEEVYQNLRNIIKEIYNEVTFRFLSEF